MNNPSKQALSTRLDAPPRLPSDIQKLLDDLECRYAGECEAVLAGWQGPSPARARLIDEVETRYRKHKASLMRRFSDRVG